MAEVLSNLLLEQGEQLVAATALPYANEQELHDILARKCELLDVALGDATQHPLFLLQSEVGVPAELYGADQWSLDLLFVDAAAVLTLVEVKLERNAEIRRQVVGQVIDYAAHAALHWTPTFLVELLRKSSFTIRDGEDVEAFAQEVHANLRAGRMRLVIASDRLPEGLRRMITFLNESTQELEVLGVELPRFDIDGRRVFAPTLVGRTLRVTDRRLPRSVPIDTLVSRASNDIQELFGRLEAALPPSLRDTTKYRYWALANGAEVNFGAESGALGFQVSTIPHTARDSFLERLRAIAPAGRNLPPEYPSLSVETALDCWTEVRELLDWLSAIPEV